MPKPMILVVEDEPAIADAIQYALEFEGFQCHRLAAGAEVVATLERQPVALVVLDIGLPDVSGIEVCRQIRQRHDVPVIFLTARGTEVDRVVGLELGADDYVTKPFSPRELAARVKAVLRRVAGHPAARGAAFEVDEERCQVSYFGKPLDLSRYEYRLLCLFIKRPGRVYSREQLMDLAWESPEMAPVAAAAMVNTVAEGLATQMAARGLTLEIRVPERLTLTGNAFLLHQALANLLQNAIDFSPEGGKITVSAAADKQRVTIAVADDGPGIPEYALPKVFDRFYSLARPGTGKKSTGLGLNFVREVAQMHDGIIRLSNRAGGGALAELTLPHA